LIRYHQLSGDFAARNSNHITAGTVSCVIHHRRRISKRVLHALGLRKAVVGDGPRVLDASDIRRLLETEVAAAGSQSEWARKNRIDRAFLNKVLRKGKPPSAKLIRALGLRIVVMSD
jgi:DNA-binding phage protein